MVKFGVDNLQDFAHLIQGRVALITTPSGRTAENESTIEALRRVCDLQVLLDALMRLEK